MSLLGADLPDCAIPSRFGFHFGNCGRLGRHVGASVVDIGRASRAEADYEHRKQESQHAEEPTRYKQGRKVRLSRAPTGTYYRHGTTLPSRDAASHAASSSEKSPRKCLVSITNVPIWRRLGR